MTTATITIHELSIADAAHIEGPAHTIFSNTPYGVEGYGFTTLKHTELPHRSLKDDTIILYRSEGSDITRTYLSNHLVKLLAGLPGSQLYAGHTLTIGARTYYELTDQVMKFAFARIDYPARSAREQTTTDRNYAILAFASLV